MPNGFDENSQVKKEKKKLDPEDFMDQNVLYWVGLRHAKPHDRVKTKPGYQNKSEK